MIIAVGPRIFCAPSGMASGGGVARGGIRGSIRKGLLDIISQLRHGNRPSLVGKIHGLTPIMEKAFRSGQCQIVMVDIGNYQVLRIFGGATVISYGWSEIGLSNKPSLAEKRAAFEIYKNWKKEEVGFPAGDLEEAQEALEREFTRPYGITIVNAANAGELYHAMEILKLLPEKVLKSGLIRCVDLEGRRIDASRFGRYDSENKEVSTINPYAMWDRYMFTAVLLHELGHPLYYSLTADQKQGLERLQKRFRANGAVFGTDFMGMNIGLRISYQSEMIEFFAENFMHYIILGRSMIGSGRNQPLRKELYSFYRSILPSLEV